MDAVTIGAVLLAILSGAGSNLGEQLWAGVSLLVRRPFRRSSVGEGSSATPAGQEELGALERAPEDRDRAVALAEVLIARAGADTDFKQALEAWWEQSAPLRTGAGNVTNVVSGGIQQGPVIQGRDFTGLTFGATPPPVPQAPDQKT